VYWPGINPFIKRAYRNETYIKKLATAISEFNEELDETVTKIEAWKAGAV
jgi:hypothetical protein